MEPNLLEPAFLSTLGLMLTYKCTIACPHCIVKAGPHRKEEMRVENALAWIEQARAYRNGHIEGIALTGGEPFYNQDMLAHISAYAKTLGFIVSVVTNAYWASTPESACETLERLPAIRLLAISTDVYHQRFIPIEFVKNAIYAAQRLGRRYNIAVCTNDETDPGYLATIDELTRIGEADRIRLSITFPTGRAQRKAHPLQYQLSNEPTVAACSMAGSPIIFPDGKVLACIGPLFSLPHQHPMLLGNAQAEPLAQIFDRAEINPLLHLIRIWGPHKLISLLKQNGYGDLLPSGYIVNCTCDVCFKLLSDQRIIAALERILDCDSMRHLLAYGRLYYLHEGELMDIYHLYGSPTDETPPTEAEVSIGALLNRG
jgi:hypothetical protein